jgi:hypothetical protein
MSEINSRTERAWERLQDWARRWHRPDATYFVGTLGGASLTQVYFADVRLDSVEKLLNVANARLLAARRQEEMSEVSSLTRSEIAKFLISSDHLADANTSVRASAEVSLAGGAFEHKIIAHRLVGVTADADVTLTWVPLLAFLGHKDLKNRFLAIFGWFFNVQQILEAKRVLLCLEYCPDPRENPSAWMEI